MDRRVAPRASILIEAMRDIGYSLETALADIVDNSISAEANNISIFLEANGKSPLVAVLDDGKGMAASELEEAMRPGAKNPLETRATDDLGRFGLGLKTASFSQCRRLTVASKRDGKISAARWDLDHVAERDDWLLQILRNDEIADLEFIDRLSDHGTLVIWEKLDRLADSTSGAALKDHLYERIDGARRHMELVFHRFLDGERPCRKTSIDVNGHPLIPFDPFNSKHPATIRLHEEVIRAKPATIKVQPFILPHHKKISPSEWDRFAGDGGYLKNQGFYLYRAGRLIVHGTWFRLAKQEELTKLARVRVDIPNGVDPLWKIDVKKASAHPPFVIRERLKKIIEEITVPSNRVYTARGRKLVDPTITAFWLRRVDKNEIFYEINREHPSIQSFFSLLNGSQEKDFESVLRVIERSFPVDSLFSDVSSKPESLGNRDIPSDTLRALLKLTCDVLANQNSSPHQIREILKRTEPFRSNWEMAESILSELMEFQA
jgi:hypothetical protein